MTRVPQPAGVRGSLKWIQRAVNDRPHILDGLVLSARSDIGAITWVSPLANDDFAEYRDSAFLNMIGCGRLAGALAGYWPQRGPQWDALGRTDRGNVLLVEAKAHVEELCSPGSQAGETSRRAIEAALASTAAYLRARPRTPWIDTFYQLANRYAHLHFLRSNGIDAHLFLVNFVGDDEVKGPGTAAEWEAAYKVVHHVLGIAQSHPLAPYVHHIYPAVADL